MTEKFGRHIHLDIPKDLSPKVDEIGNMVGSLINKTLMAQVERIDDALCKQICDIAASNGIDDVYVLDKKNILDALQKQIPKKPYYEGHNVWAICSVCGGSIYLKNVQEHIQCQETTYCEHCGQALDWSDTE